MCITLRKNMLERRMEVKRRLIALAAALCLLFSGCSPITLSVEDLMRPPQLSENQRQVHDALMAALGTSDSNISLRYPRSGNNRSAFTFFDLDGDGQDEAMVFYTLADAPDEFYINVMEQGEQGQHQAQPGYTLPCECRRAPKKQAYPPRSRVKH
jgi:hypothetical protein